MEIISKEKLHEGFLKLNKYNIKHNGQEFEREFIDVGKTVCALVHNTKTDKFVFVRQFRPGVADVKLIELPGGWVEDDNPMQTIYNEVVEEVGYKPDKVEKIFDTFFVPGYSSEDLGFYYVRVSEKISNGGGLEHEDEFIEIIELSREEVKKLQPEETDAKTLMILSTTNLIDRYNFIVYNNNRMKNPDERFGGC